MTDVRVALQLASPADVVWALIGDFGALHRWHPAVQRLDLSWEGRIRTLHFADGSRAVERLETRNDPARRHVYASVVDPLPMHHCRSTLQVVERDDGCVVTWSSTFEPSTTHELQVQQALQHRYSEGLNALATALAGAR